MKVVLHTNVLLSGVFVRGLCEDVLDRYIESDTITPVLSEYILTEFERCAREKFGVPAQKAQAARRQLGGLFEIVSPPPVAAEACPDPDDLPVLGTLLAADADCLVTGDKALLKMKAFSGHPILSPRAFLDGLPPDARPSDR